MAWRWRSWISKGNAGVGQRGRSFLCQASHMGLCRQSFEVFIVHSYRAEANEVLVVHQGL